MISALASRPTSNNSAPKLASQPSNSIWQPFANCSIIWPPEAFWTSTRPPQCVGQDRLVKRGKTPVLWSEEARKLLDSIESNTLIGLRDRAFIGAMVYSFARVGAVVTVKAGDYFQDRKRWWLRLHERAGKRHEIPCHPSLEEYLNAWLSAAGITHAKKGPLFRSMGKNDRLGERAMSRFDVLDIIKRQAEVAGLPYSISATPFVRPELRPIFRMEARWSTPRPSPITSRRIRPNYTIAPARNSPSRKWRGLN